MSPTRHAPLTAVLSLHGIAASSGYAIGRAMLYSHHRLEAPHYTLRRADIAAEIARFDAAIAEVRADLSLLKQHIPESAPPELAAFLDVHTLILGDSLLCEAPKELIRTERCNAEWAMAKQTAKLIAQFESIEDPYFSERHHDVRQVADKVMKSLLGHPSDAPLRASDESAILVAHDLAPSDMVIFKRQPFAGFLTDLGGSTSHTAILARSLNIPAVMAMHTAHALIHEGDMLVVDGIAGVVLVNPDPHTLEEYALRQNQWHLEQKKLKRLKSSPSTTLDGVHIDLLANIDLPQDVTEALAENAAGVGLFRTEFLFMNRNDLPSEEEQFEAYRHVLTEMRQRPVVLRTLDVGADKTAPWFKHESANPVLGLRAIRLCLTEPQIFITQLRAILRASHYGNARILIPMLSDLTEIDQALTLLRIAKEQLRAEGWPFDEGIQVGGMIEVPAAALSAEWFARHLDFLSIGTNDLIQYTLAIDRTDDTVVHLYNPLHPAILQLISHTLRVGQKLGKPVSICGEMAGDALLTRLLLGLGLRSFSMHPAHLLRIKQQVLHSQVSELTPLAIRILRQGHHERIQELLQKMNG